QFGIDVRRKDPARTDLADAIRELLAGKDVTRAETEVSGCRIGLAAKPKPDATVACAKDGARILQQNCEECHRPGQIGPMPLLTYADAAGWALTIREQVEARRRPPGDSAPKLGHVSHTP